MTETKVQHTPGPWEVEGATVVWSPTAKAVIAQASQLRETQDVRFSAPSCTSPDFHEIAANARLIAAAPDLLRVAMMAHSLEYWAKNVCRCEAEGNADGLKIQQGKIDALLSNIRAAIAAADEQVRP